jgi:hypothetical protein
VTRSFVFAVMVSMSAFAGPVEFGLAELKAAFASRGLDFNRLRVKVELDQNPPETYHIQPGRVTGGDIRGLMYGLLEAADQIRAQGRMSNANGIPATPIRGIRKFIHNEDLERSWYYSPEYWQSFFQMLARNRFNRFNLVFAHQTAYLAPPYPFWVSIQSHPEITVPGLSAAQRDRNLKTLQYISQTAVEYGVDFTLGIWEHNIQPNMTPPVRGLTRDNIGPYSYEALKKVLAECPGIRSVQMRTNAESGIPNADQAPFHRDWVFRAIREAGRRVTLDLRGWAMQPGLMEAATSAGVPLRLSSKYWAEDIGRPYQPAETWPGYSYINFLERPRPYGFYWELWGLGSDRLTLWGDPDYVRRAVPTFALAGSLGFEIDPPLAQKGFGNRPGVWGVFTEAHKDLEWWRWDFERYWLFYLLWGRLSYDPATPERVWMSEFEKRFGPAARDAFDAYRQASRILPEIVAAHLADPNMYIWPEINPGGLIDAYKEVRPSDWRYIACIDEAVRNRLGGVASAKQTPRQTAAILNEAAAGVTAAVDRARAKVAKDRVEWRASEPDFLVLAQLARYHAHKQIAADELTEFDLTGNAEPLERAKRELEAGLSEWRKLVELTDGLYPAEMAFGPDDIGCWKDKLAYVEDDLKLVAEREEIWRRFGAFAYGFDFGGPLPQRRGASYRNDPFVVDNPVAPRFRPVDPCTAYSAERGFGWVSTGERSAHALANTPYAEVRATAPNPRHLPSNTLFGDWIHGDGPQVFGVRTGSGKFDVQLLKPDGTTAARTLEARDGRLDIAMPDGAWNIAGVVIGANQPPRKTKSAARLESARRPTITHTPAATAFPGRPLELRIRATPGTSVGAIRLHYRAVNQLATFKTLEHPAADATFAIPAEDVSPKWDLMYYFEILSKDGGGWFAPDPHVATPYYVVKTNETNSSNGGADGADRPVRAKASGSERR